MYFFKNKKGRFMHPRENGKYKKFTDEESANIADLIGEKVCLRSNHGTDDEAVEFGFISDAWLENEISGIDCYVLLESELNAKLDRYRYALSSLEKLFSEKKTGY